MGSVWHRVQARKGQSFPRNMLYFDCEAKLTTDFVGVETHTLKLGVANYVRYEREDHLIRDLWHTFVRAADLWEWVTGQAEKDRRLVIVGYNVGYDVRIANAFRCLKGLGYKQTRLYLSQSVVILEFRRDKHIIEIIDAMNFFEGSLHEWGEMLATPKLEVDFSTVGRRQLEKYCRRDVEILRKLWEQWRAFVLENDLGHYCRTKASQAFTAFCHRFMRHKLVVHANEEATEIERLSYHGGRVECWHVGWVPGGPFAKLDVNAMYPAIMSSTAVPLSLRGIARSPSVDRLWQLSRRFGVIAEVEVDADSQRYPYSASGSLVWPVGRFWTCLAGPELALAFKEDEIRACRRVCVYSKAVIFKGYVAAMYRLRQAYAQEGNTVCAEMVKYLMNMLYGKFGQRCESWKDMGEELRHVEGSWRVYDHESGQVVTYYNIAGQLWAVRDGGEPFGSMVGIASYITSAARGRLWKLIDLAGAGHVFYTDTDSLIVDRVGYEKLVHQIDEHKLGLLKLEYWTEKLKINSPKDYETDHEVKMKGVRSQNRRIDENTFEVQMWEGLRGAIGKGNLDHVIVRPSVKVLSRRYTKGQVSSSGSVTPLTVAEIAARSARSLISI